MNEPEQNQPINPDEGQEAAGLLRFRRLRRRTSRHSRNSDSTTSLNMARCPTSIRRTTIHTCMGLPTSPSRRTMHDKRRSGRRRIRICRTGIRRIHMMHRDGSNQASPMAISMDQINTGQTSMGRIHTNSPAYIPSTRMIPARTPVRPLG